MISHHMISCKLLVSADYTDVTEIHNTFSYKRFLTSVRMCVCTGTYVTCVTATDADDPTYGNSAHIVYSVLYGQPYFSVEPKTGTSRFTASLHHKNKAGSVTDCN